jgi:hypothetical protein
MPRIGPKVTAKDNSDFRQRLSLCAARVKNLSALSASAELKQRTVWSYSRGTEPPRPALIAIARAARVRLSWLVAGEEPMELGENEPAQVSNFGLYPDPFLKIPPAGGGIAIRELLPVYNPSSSSRELRFGEIALWIRSDVAAAQFPHVNIPSLAACASNDATHQPVMKRGEWIIIDTSRRNLFEGVGAIRIENDVMVRGMHLCDPVVGPLTYMIGSKKRPPGEGLIKVTNSQLGGAIDLLGEVVYGGRLEADGGAMRST